MRDSKSACKLVPNDVVVIYLDEEAGKYHFGTHGVWLPAFWRRVPARIVEAEEQDGTAVEGTVDVVGDTVHVLGGSSNERMVRFFIGLDRYTQIVPARFIFEVLAPHHPVCIECVEPWPCREHRQGVEADRFAMELDDLCQHCGKRISGAWSTSFHDGMTRRRYHLAQKYRGPDGRRCKDAAADAHRQIPGVLRG